MRSRCDKLRESVLRERLNSKDALAWRVHCRSCHECRTELFILESLEHSVNNSNQHLGRTEVAELLRIAKGQCNKERGTRPVWNWALRFACALFVVALLAEFVLQYQAPLDGGPAAETIARIMRDGNTAQQALSPGKEETAAKGMTAPAAFNINVLAWPYGAFGSDVDRELHQIRQRIDSRREQLIDLIERDLDKRMRQDAWKRDLSATSPV